MNMTNTNKGFTTAEKSAEMQMQFRMQCSYRRNGKNIEEKDSEGKWHLRENYPTMNIAKRASSKLAGKLYKVS
jgi:hypothetical protein